MALAATTARTVEVYLVLLVRFVIMTLSFHRGGSDPAVRPLVLDLAQPCCTGLGLTRR
jgi:hypothetical protein